MNAVSSKTKENEAIVKPDWLAAWRSQTETLAILRLIRPGLHKTTLARMRRCGKIDATKFAGEWYYKPETAFPPLKN